MRSLISILLLSLTMVAAGQYQVNFRTGDHIYYMDQREDWPMHYQVDRENDLIGLVQICDHLTEFGIPGCELWIDPGTTRMTVYHSGGDLRVQAIADQVNPGVAAINNDTATMPLFIGGQVKFYGGRFLEVRTPQLRQATSFRIHTNNRVFVFVRKPEITAQDL